MMVVISVYSSPASPTVVPDKTPLTNREFLELYFTASSLEAQEQLCAIARKSAKKQRLKWGTKEQQVKRLYETEQPRREERKRKRQATARRKEEKRNKLLHSISTNGLITKKTQIQALKGPDLFQLSLWAELSRLGMEVSEGGNIKNTSKLNVKDRKRLLSKLIISNPNVCDDLDDYLPLSYQKTGGRRAEEQSSDSDEDNIPLANISGKRRAEQQSNDSDDDNIPLAEIMDWYESDDSDMATN